MHAQAKEHPIQAEGMLHPEAAERERVGMPIHAVRMWTQASQRFKLTR